MVPEGPDGLPPPEPRCYQWFARPFPVSLQGWRGTRSGTRSTVRSVRARDRPSCCVGAAAGLGHVVAFALPRPLRRSTQSSRFRSGSRQTRSPVSLLPLRLWPSDPFSPGWHSRPRQRAPSGVGGRAFERPRRGSGARKACVGTRARAGRVLSQDGGGGGPGQADNAASPVAAASAAAGEAGTEDSGTQPGGGRVA